MLSGGPQRRSRCRADTPSATLPPRRRRPRRGQSGPDTSNVEALPEDGEGPYRREKLLRMDNAFVAAVERAFQNWGEHRQSAAMNGATASRSR
jgi:hypothetical protein